MKKMNRILSLLLCMAMLLGMLPVGALAEGTDTIPTDPVSVTEPAATEETQATETTEAAGETDPTESTDATDATETTDETTPAEETDPSEEVSSVAEEEQASTDNGIVEILLGSDFQAKNGHDASVANVNDIMAQVVNDYPDIDAFIFAGDYDVNYNSCDEGQGYLQSAVQTVFADLNTNNMVFVQGNHDRTQGVIFTASGNQDAMAYDNAYGIFVINEQDYMWKNSNQATIQATANNLKAYLDAKLAAKDSRPIFVVSHLPLHYSMRTHNDGDGMYANLIFDVLNEYAGQGLNIFFTYGHDHSNGWDDYLGGASVFLNKGSKINIAQGSRTDFKEETLNFTYFNAGFVGYYENWNGIDDTLTMTVAQISNGGVTFTRYSAAGVHVLKAAGVTNTHKNESGYDPNTTIVASPAYVAPNVFEPTIGGGNPTIGGGNPADPTDPTDPVDPTVPNTVTDTNTNVTVTAPGAQSVTAVLQSTDIPDTGKYGAYAAYNITVEGFENNSGEATVTIPVPDTFKHTKKVTVWDGGYSNDVSLGEFTIVNGAVTFTTTHFSQYDLTQDADVTADTGVIYLLAGSDFQDGTENHEQSAANVTAILNAIRSSKGEAFNPNGLLFAGDYGSSAAGTTAGIDALLSTVNTVFPNQITSQNIALAQGECDAMDSRILPTGGHHFDGYGVYVINEDAFPVDGGNSTTVYALGTKLYDYLHTRMDARYTGQPVFIVSHVPLLYSTRTAQDGSGKYANYLFEMINNAGHAGLNIFFIHGSNHEYGYDNYLGGEAIYLTRGTRVPVISSGESTTSYEQHTLQFTYMNAGYTGYYSDTGSTVTDGQDQVSMTLFTIANGQVTVERFGRNGAAALDASGRSGAYTANQPTDFVHTSTGKLTDTPAVESVEWYNVELYKDADITIKVVSHHALEELKPQSGDIVTRLNSTDSPETANKLAALENDLVYSEYHAFDVKLNENINVEDEFFGTVMISLPVSWPASHVLIYKIAEDGTLTTIPHKITGMTNADDTVTSIAAIRATSGGTYAVACMQNQAETAPVQYHRADKVTGITSGIWLIGFDASTQYSTDALVLPLSVTSGGYTGMEIEEIANITQYQILGVRDYQSAYEWELTYAEGEDLTDGTRGYRFSKDGKYLVINADHTLGFVDTAEAGDIFYMIATTDQPDNADAYAYAIRNAKGQYLTFNIDNTMVTGASNDATKSRFVLFEYKQYDPNTGLIVPSSTIGTLKEISGLAGSAAYTYTRDTDGVDAGESYRIVASNAAWALDGWNGVNNLDRKTVELTSDGVTLTDYAYEGLDWTFQQVESNTYWIYTTVGNTTYYLINNDGSLNVTPDISAATEWTVTLNSSNYRIYVQSGYRYYYLTHSNNNGFSLGNAWRLNNVSSLRLYGDRQDPAVQGMLYALADSGGKRVFPVAYETTVEQAKALVQQDVTVYTYDSSDILNANRTELDDSKVDWVWVDTFEPGVSGYYTMSIRVTDSLGKKVSLGTVEVLVQEGVGHFKDPQQITMNYTDDNGTAQQREYFAFLEGQRTYEVGAGVYTEEGLLALVQAGVTAYRTDSLTVDGVVVDQGTNKTVMGDGMLKWEWDNGVDPNAAGSYSMTISYEDSDNHTTELGTVYVNVVQKEVASYGLSTYYGVVRAGAADTAIVKDSNGENVKLVIQYVNGTTDVIPVTVGMLRHSTGGAVDVSEAAFYLDLDVYYNDKEVSYDTFTLQVLPRVVADYPEYPDEGAVKVNKTAMGYDFQSSGVARVELSASGLPVKKGADVIVMMDTSSSMRNNDVRDEQGNSMSRLSALQQSLENMIATFKTPGEDGELLDIRVAIADFNGYSNSGPYALDNGDYVGVGQSGGDGPYGKVYTGSGVLDAAAFLPAEDLAATYVLQNDKSGTNYDYAMDAIYQLGNAIRQQEIAATGEYDRDLFVIFLSDGAPFQWNYYSSRSSESNWNHWLSGDWSGADLTDRDKLTLTHAYYYDQIDWDGDGQINEHRMANAIKGSPNNRYQVIRKSEEGISGSGADGQPVLQAGTQENIYNVPGLGATMFSIAYNILVDQQITVETQRKVIRSIATDDTGTATYSYNVNSAAELDNAFQSIAGEITYAATQARFLDQMGDAYDIQLGVKNYEVPDGNGGKIQKSIVPSIEILTYDVYTRSDYEKNLCKLDEIGTRKGTDPKILEVVMFNEDGTEAYSTLIDGNGDGQFGVVSDGNGGWKLNPNRNAADCILSSEDVTSNGVTMHAGVIYAKTFVYNTRSESVSIEGVKIPTSVTVQGTTSATTTSVLPGETFYWKMDTITHSELAMRYYVYLTGASEGTRPAGSYSTNNFAVLYYDNYLGNRALMSTTSPSMAWKSANVSYAFYLVNSAGAPLVNQTTGLLGSFANKIALTTPVVYQEILLNNNDTVTSMEVKAHSKDVLPEYYTLYDSAASYRVDVNSNATGGWTITKGAGKANSTYVTQYNPADPTKYSNDLTQSSSVNDYTHTVVWFAVVWNIQTTPDTVVIDYGSPVAISVLNNDMFGEQGSVTGVGPYVDGMEDKIGSEPDVNFAEEKEFTYGTARVENSKVVYTPKSMAMAGPEIFAYQVYYPGTSNAGNYYGKVTVIPATSIYYEDSFLEFKTFDSGTEVSSNWTMDGENAGLYQDEDRPGQFSLGNVDANNVYGFDSSYSAFTKYSMGSAMKTTVKKGTYSTASFTFSGTGFDVISMTSSDTGTIMVTVKDMDDNVVTRRIVDTYYGYTSGVYAVTYEYQVEEGASEAKWVMIDKVAYTDDGQLSDKPENPDIGDTYTAREEIWSVDPDSTDAVYQVPVMKVSDLEYGTYKVEIRAAYDVIFDHDQNNASNSYDFYLDAIRVYNPAADGTGNGDIIDAYLKDNEGWPKYEELRNKILSAGSFNDGMDGSQYGVVYIDGKSSGATVSDYTSYGPNNEVYLAKNQAIAFRLTIEDVDNIADVQIGVKSADGNPIVASVFNVNEKGAFNEASRNIATSTEMYYSAKNQCTFRAENSSDNSAVVVLQNTGEGIMSITNIKITYKSDPSVQPAMVMFSMSAEEAGWAVMALSLDDGAEDTLPEETQPEQTEPVETQPVATEPEATEPAATEVEETLPAELEIPLFDAEQEKTEEFAAPAVTFAPSVALKANFSSVRINSNVKFTITTSADVAYVTFNGTSITEFTENGDGTRSWIIKVSALNLGDMSVEVVAYNEAGVASVPQVGSILVTEHYTSLRNLISDIIEWFAKML